MKNQLYIISLVITAGTLALTACLDIPPPRRDASIEYDLATQVTY
jgi:hypothetical protein